MKLSTLPSEDVLTTKTFPWHTVGKHFGIIRSRFAQMSHEEGYVRLSTQRDEVDKQSLLYLIN